MTRTTGTIDNERLTLLQQAVKERKIRGLDGYTFCFTGNMSMSRDEMIQMIYALGGGVSQTVTNRTTHLVAENVYGRSGKLQAARNRGVSVISEQDLSNMMNFQVN